MLANIKSAPHRAALILGGGTAGSAAGIAAARAGADTLVVEREAALGGTATLAQVMPMMSVYIDGNPDTSGLNREIKRRLRDEGYCEAWGSNDGVFNHEMLKLTLEEMAVEAKCGLLYNTELIGAETDGRKITGVIVHNRDGLTKLTADVYVDATGDAALAKAAGVECHEGHNGKNQHMSLRFMMGGIDEEAAYNGLSEIGCWCESSSRLYFASTWTGEESKLKELLRIAAASGVIKHTDSVYIQAFSVPGMPGVMAFNCPEAHGLFDANDAGCVTQVAVMCRAIAKRLLAFCKKYLKGFDKAFIASTAPMPGIRESRRIEARYQVTADDYNNRARFDDAVAQTAYPIDIHGWECDTIISEMQKGEFMEVPFRSMLPKEIDNLLVAGRCSGADFLAQSALRIQPTCRAMGEAAGIAAAMAARSGISVCDVDGISVRKAMADNGGVFK